MDSSGRRRGLLKTSSLFTFIQHSRLVRRRARLLRAVALPAVVLVALVVLTLLRTRHPRPHTHTSVLAQPLPTRWNLTCPPPIGVKLDVPEGEVLPLTDAVPCEERDTRQRSVLHNGRWVLYNYVAALERPLCWEAVTLTTHGDFTYLGSLGPLVRRWRAPISLALYAPGDDLQPTVAAILWARACVEPPLVAQYVSFHVLMDAVHAPDTVPPPPRLSAENVQKEAFNCAAEEAPWLQVGAADTYRWRLGLVYPINVARNVAREAAHTHYVLASDIELLPSAGVSAAFLATLSRRGLNASKLHRHVFVLPVFEVALGVEPPENKEQLVEQLRSGIAAPFHEHICSACHGIPQPQRWVCSPPRKDGILGVTAVAKREGAFRHWEPFFIGTHQEPLYEEGLSWEGKKDKMVQSYIMCLLGYRFYVLDDAFLVHQPGVKAPNSDAWRAPFIKETQNIIDYIIKPELTKQYGQRSECFL